MSQGTNLLACVVVVGLFALIMMWIVQALS